MTSYNCIDAETPLNVLSLFLCTCPYNMAGREPLLQTAEPLQSRLIFLAHAATALAAAGYKKQKRVKVFIVSGHY